MNTDPSTEEKIGKEIADHIALRIAKIVGLTVAGIFAAIFLGFIVAWAVQFLWKETLVPMFNWPMISYWQALGLFILAKIFFGFGGNGGHAAPRQSKEDRKRDARVHKWWRKRTGGAATDAVVTEDAEFKQYWEQEGKAAFDAYLASRKDASNEPKG